MTDYGTITEAGTVRFERLLPGPIERVWAYLTESDKRAKWLAYGDMDLRPGGAMEYVWRNWELALPGETVPEKWKHVAENDQVMKGHILKVEPPYLLVHSWGDASSSAEVSFELQEEGDKVRLILTNRRLPDRGELVGVSGGWHSHLQVLEEVLSGRPRSPYWPTVERLHDEYEARTPA